MLEDNALKETLEILLHFEIGRNEVQKYLETFKNARELQIQHFSGDFGVEESLSSRFHENLIVGEWKSPLG